MMASLIKNPSPTELASPAYAGRQEGQSRRGSKAIPIPGSVPDNWVIGFTTLL